jgi:hypothetical protein
MITRRHFSQRGIALYSRRRDFDAKIGGRVVR